MTAGWHLFERLTPFYERRDSVESVGSVDMPIDVKNNQQLNPVEFDHLAAFCCLSWVMCVRHCVFSVFLVDRFLGVTLVACDLHQQHHKLLLLSFHNSLIVCPYRTIIIYNNAVRLHLISIDWPGAATAIGIYDAEIERAKHFT